jgi:hypothetical protein
MLGAQLLETVAAHLLLHGNAFVQCLQDGEGRLAQLFPLRPERVKVEADASGWPAAYLYKVGEAKLRVPVRDGLGRPGLVHLRALHPLDDHYGLGLPGRGGGGGGDPQPGDALEQGAARQCGAAERGAELPAGRRIGAVGGSI